MNVINKEMIRVQTDVFTKSLLFIDFQSMPFNIIKMIIEYKTIMNIYGKISPEKLQGVI